MEIEELRRFYSYLLDTGVIDEIYDLESFDEYILDNYLCDRSEY